MSRLRICFVAACLLAVIGLSLAVIGLPWLEADLPGILLLLCLLAALVAGGRRLWRWPRPWLAPLALAALAMVPFVIAARGFRRLDMIAVLFHVEFGTEGANLSGFVNETIQAVVAASMLVLGLVLLRNWLGLGRGLFVGSAVVLLIANPISLYSVWSAIAAEIDSDLVARLRTADIGPPPAVLPDIVLIYLEGTERTFLDRPGYDGALDALAPLDGEGLTLTGVRQIEGTEWSLAGIVASQCGVPLLPNGLRFRNNFAGMGSFLGRQVCLGDFLRAYGYATEFVVGNDSEFAGYDNFFNSHGFPTIFDQQDFHSITSEAEFEAALAGWVMDDQIVFEAARQRFLDLRAKAEPLALVIETIAPHGNTTFISRNCSDDGRAKPDYDLGRALRCTADETAAMVEFLRANRRDRPLAIAILSDHLNHSCTAASVFAGGPRSNLALFLDLGGPRRIDREASMVDIYPTLLAWLGFVPPDTGAGLGVSLLGTAPTLVEEKGLDRFNAELMPNPALSQAIWAETGG